MYSHGSTKLQDFLSHLNQVITLRYKKNTHPAPAGVANKRSPSVKPQESRGWIATGDATNLRSPPLHFSRPTDGDRPPFVYSSPSLPRPPPRPRSTPPFFSIHPSPHQLPLSRFAWREKGREKSSRSREQLNSTGRGFRKGEAWCEGEGEGAETATSTAAGGRAVPEASSPPCIWIRRPLAAAASCSHRRRLEIPPGPGCSSSFLGTIQLITSSGGKKICVHGFT